MVSSPKNVCTSEPPGSPALPKERGLHFFVLVFFVTVCLFAKRGEGVSRTITLDSGKKKKSCGISCHKAAAPRGDLDYRRPRRKMRTGRGDPPRERTARCRNSESQVLFNINLQAGTNRKQTFPSEPSWEEWEPFCTAL